MFDLPQHLVDTIIMNALNEDIGTGDLTTNAIFTKPQITKADLVAKEDCILAGIPIAERVFTLIDKTVKLQTKHTDGNRLTQGTTFASISGDVRSILQGERVALNFLQRMCGITTMTRQYADAVMSTKARVVDTRKTTPGLRLFEKYAVRVGGGYNHRFGLYDAVLIKDNHIEATGSITKAIEKARKAIPHTVTIEVEVETLNQVKEAVKAKPHIIMLDNMNTKTMKKAVQMIGGQTLVEASGGITLATVKEVAATGVDIISVGALTHSVKAIDISLAFK